MIRILVVDEDELMRAQWLDWGNAREGFSVQTAANLDESIDKADQLKPDVCLLDLEMPHGTKTLERLKNVSPNTEMIVIAAHNDIQAAMKATKNGACVYLKNPISFGDAEEAIAVASDRALEGNLVRSECSL